MSDRVAPSLLALSAPQRARRTGWPIGQTTSVRTTGAYDDRATSAASKRCLRSWMPAVVRPVAVLSAVRGDVKDQRVAHATAEPDSEYWVQNSSAVDTASLVPLCR